MVLSVATVLADSPPRADRTTAELLDDADLGDRRAWEELVRRFTHVVDRAVRAYRLQHADAGDATQRTWLRLLENHQQLRRPDALAGWLATTAGRECLRILRARHRTANLAEADELIDPAGDPEQVVIDAVTVDELREHIALLPPRARTLMDALFGDGPLGYAEIARRTGIPIGSIGPTRARALGQLRALIGEPSLGPAPVRGRS
jgi:RNA polymerase sigma factor (sigma-70 family)